MKTAKKPKHLYKIISLNHWNQSQQEVTIHLTEHDKEFIHLAEEDQLEKILEKFWNGIPEFVILKLDTAKLSGQLILESNPGGKNKYYHLYNGVIPLHAVLESKIISK